MTPRTILIATVTTLAALASACGGSAPIEGAATVAVEEPDATTTAVVEPATTEAETTTEPATTEAETTTTEAAPVTAEAAAIDAAVIFEDNCARCHGSDGTGGRGPSLVGIVADHPTELELVGLVTNGTPDMPSFGGKLSEAEIEAVSEYARTNF